MRELLRKDDGRNKAAGHVPGYDKNPFKITYHFNKLEQPLKWKNLGRSSFVQWVIFFHEDVPTGLIIDIFGVITGP